MTVRNFTLAEFSHSVTALERGIDNAIPDDLEAEAIKTLKMLQRIRDHLSSVAGRDTPVTLSSGYRCAALNKAVGGSGSSDHLYARAADITAPTFGHPLRIAQTLAPVVSVLGIGQLIYERPKGSDRAWIHVSTRIPEKPVNRIITITPNGARVGIVP